MLTNEWTDKSCTENMGNYNNRRGILWKYEPDHREHLYPYFKNKIQSRKNVEVFYGIKLRGGGCFIMDAYYLLCLS